MTHIVLGLLLTGGINVSLADEVEPFDLENPPLPRPGKKYRLVIEPCEAVPPVTLLFVAADDAADPTPESRGLPWTGIASIETDGEELPVSAAPGVLHVEVADYDGDGCRDVRIPVSWGTGGTWYAYLRFDGRRYVEWKEPAELGINGIDVASKTASASSRSGPSYARDLYKIVDGRFILAGRQIYDQAKEHREVVPREISDNDYVLIEETVEAGVTTKRTVTKRNPWEDESETTADTP